MCRVFQDDSINIITFVLIIIFHIVLPRYIKSVGNLNSQISNFVLLWFLEECDVYNSNQVLFANFILKFFIKC